jgi:hypothetical protein
MIDPRDAAQEKYYEIGSHHMHNMALLRAQCEHAPHSQLYHQWNKTFTGWERTAEYRVPDLSGYGQMVRMFGRLA